MPNPEQQNQPEDETKNALVADASRPEAKIRTMKSDIAEYMKGEKTSLLDIMTKQQGAPTTSAERKPRIPPLVVITVSAAALIFIAVGGWFIYQSFTPATAPMRPAEEKIPTSPISVEKTQALEIANNLTQLRQALSSAAAARERAGSFKRLHFRIKGAGDTRQPATTQNFLAILNTNLQDILAPLSNEFFFYIYYGASGPRTVFIAASRDTARTFTRMLGRENSLQRDLEVFFLEEGLEPVIAPFIDKTLKNVDYRFLSLKQDTGIGYFIFPAKNYFVMTTSEEALEVTINRLFETR